MIRFFKSLYLRPPFFIALGVIAVAFLVSFSFPIVFPIAQGLLVVLVSLSLVDILFLYGRKAKVLAKRKVNSQLSLGDDNKVAIFLKSTYRLPLRCKVIDEVPYQLQERFMERTTTLNPKDTQIVPYTFRPVKRGEYVFHTLNVYVSTPLNLMQRRFRVDAEEHTAVYPSVIQMKKYELKVFSKTSMLQGIKKIRRLGHNNEFEQIKNYVQGDDFRSINWKATSRRAELMVNQYQDERAQQVYCIIDKSRSMRMPFEKMTLLDHAINASLVISNIALQKFDKAGIITFSDKLGTRLKADRNSNQLRRIMEVLYKQRTRYMEANYELLYYGVRNYVKGRSLVLLFTNFESVYALQRVLPLLRRINKMHLLVTTFFENTEINQVSEMQSRNVDEIYFKTFARKSIIEKKMIARELQKYGIQTILTTPENLSIDTINKYLELKSRGMI